MSNKRINSISKDTYNKRTKRLSNIAANIESIGETLGLLPERIIEYKEMFQFWSYLISHAQILRGDRDMAYENYQFVFSDAYKLYMRIRKFLKAVVKNTEQGKELADGYGITHPAPRRFYELSTLIDTLKTKHDELTAAGDPRVAPENSVLELIEKKTGLVDAFNKISIEKQKSAKAYDDLHDLYKRHTQLLKVLYETACLVWGKDSPELTLLGFAPAVHRSYAGKPDQPENLSVEEKEEILEVGWDPSDNVTSYQLCFSANGKTWEVLYKGMDTTYVEEQPVENRFYKVRARNANGFSKWSDTIEFEPSEVPA